MKLYYTVLFGIPIWNQILNVILALVAGICAMFYERLPVLFPAMTRHFAILALPFYVIPLLDKGICVIFYEKLPGLFQTMTGEIKTTRQGTAENDTAISAKLLKLFYFLWR